MGAAGTFAGVASSGPPARSPAAPEEPPDAPGAGTGRWTCRPGTVLPGPGFSGVAVAAPSPWSATIARRLGEGRPGRDGSGETGVFSAGRGSEGRSEGPRSGRRGLGARARASAHVRLRPWAAL